MPGDRDLDAWDFELPPDRIARHPTEARSASRLMVLRLAGGDPSHHRFSDLPELLAPADLLVANDTRVMAARLRARRSTGGAVELLLLGPGPGDIEALARPARKLRQSEVLELAAGGRATVTRTAVDGVVIVRLDRDPIEVMAEQGSLPLPPYLERDAADADAERYQTVYAGPLGAAAAPTAGLHFDAALLERLATRGVGFTTVTLHVGLGTFRPLREEDLAAGRLHTEPYTVPPEAPARIEAARSGGGRVIAVGTTSARTLEAATPPGARVPLAGSASTDLFVRPPYQMRAVDGLITNFHLPRSSLLMLVASMIGRERLMAAYAEAVRTGYRFYSYGDAMLLL